jgi:hypothetical protein
LWLQQLFIAIIMFRSSEITALRSTLAALGIFIYEYEPMPDFRGGCWNLVVRKGDTMIRFFWDGRDDLLTIEEAAYLPSSTQFLWRPTTVRSTGVDEKRETARYIAELLKKKFYT